ncbi:MAG: hypothetical protein H0U85_02815 [Gemmatimonadales bacterium]|nr:hypothetical protein [Gemmatimonadales bacterium]
MLGVEAGVSIFDLDGEAEAACAELLRAEPHVTFEEAERRLLHQWEGNIPYRTVSPRHFEAAALRVCQILFEGRYSGVLQPMVHYIPLKKDFSNFADVVRMFRDRELRERIAGNAYRDLIGSGRYSYREFIRDFDERLIGHGMGPEISPEVRAAADTAVDRAGWFSALRPRLAGVRGGSRLLAAIRRVSGN